MCKEPKKYTVSMPCGNQVATFPATNVKESEGGFFATIENNGCRSRYFYSYNDGATYQET